MMPGASARPWAFTVSFAAPSLGPISTILPPVTPRSPCAGLAPEPSKISASLMTRSNIGLLHDGFLFDDIALDAADEEGAVGVECPHFRRAGRGLDRRRVVEPQLGDAVDLEDGLFNVGAAPLARNVVLHVAA